MKSNIFKAIMGMACALALVVAATALVSCIDTSPPDNTETGTWYVKVTNDLAAVADSYNLSDVAFTDIKVEAFSDGTGTVDTVEKTGLSIASGASSDAIPVTGTTNSSGQLLFKVTVNYTVGGAAADSPLTQFGDATRNLGKTATFTLGSNWDSTPAMNSNPTWD
jgi:hypothetical protein